MTVARSGFRTNSPGSSSSTREVDGVPSMLRLRMRPYLIGVMALMGTCFLAGCGGERTETGTQVQVSDTMLQEAAAADAYRDQEAAERKAGRKGAAKKVEENKTAAPAPASAEPNP
jgi:hypothetical protein